MYDLNYSAPKARAMRSVSGGGGEIMGGRWFERSANFAEPGSRLGQIEAAVWATPFNPFPMRFPWMKEVGQQDGKLRQIRAQAREFPKLTHRHHPAGLPFGQRIRAVHTHLQPSCVLYFVHPTSYIGGILSPAARQSRA